jgi:hypothetical protein
VLQATFELQPAGSANALADLGGTVVAEGDGTVTVDLPDDRGADVNVLVSALGAGEVGLGVPLFAHRAGSGPWARNADVGPIGAVLARLRRLYGADYVVVGAFGGKLFESTGDVPADVEPARGPCAGARPAVAALGA